jgi:hypothetical protein
MAQDYSKLKVAELKELLTSRALDTSGLKAALIARLSASDLASEGGGLESANGDNGAEVNEEGGEEAGRKRGRDDAGEEDGDEEEEDKDNGE